MREKVSKWKNKININVSIGDNYHEEIKTGTERKG
jgi:hypothetical protein